MASRTTVALGGDVPVAAAFVGHSACARAPGEAVSAGNAQI
jgi:hypothetical protein